MSRDKVREEVTDWMFGRQRGVITVRSDRKAWTRFPPDSPPSAGPAAPVVFQERDGSEWEGGVRRGVSCDSGESEQAQRGRVKAEQGLCKRDKVGLYAMSQPWLKEETEQRL